MEPAHVAPQPGAGLAHPIRLAATFLRALAATFEVAVWCVQQPPTASIDDFANFMDRWQKVRPRVPTLEGPGSCLLVCPSPFAPCACGDAVRSTINQTYSVLRDPYLPTPYG